MRHIVRQIDFNYTLVDIGRDNSEWIYSLFCVAHRRLSSGAARSRAFGPRGHATRALPPPDPADDRRSHRICRTCAKDSIEPVGPRTKRAAPATDRAPGWR